MSTSALIEHAKSHPTKWVWAYKTVNKVVEQHWLCWKHSRLYHFMHKAGQPKVVEVSIFRLAHEVVEWKLPA